MKKLVSSVMLLLLLCGAVQAKKIKGKVVCGSERLSGVVVTDGRNFTRTGANGIFRMDVAEDAEFVYIVTPSGYAADWSEGSPRFYRAASGADGFTFDLIRLDGAGDSYNIVAVADPQPHSDAQFEEFAGQPLEDLCGTISSLEGMSAGIVLGDICYDVFHLQERWKEEIVRTGIPFYPAVGNHDHDRNVSEDIPSGSTYRSNFGPENYAFCMGRDIVIVLDDIIYSGRGSYIEGYTEDVLKWVEGLMEHVSEDADIYVAQHSPLNGRNNMKMVHNHERMLELLDGHEVTFMSGHNHINGNFEYAPGVLEHNVAAICGTWWDAYHCVDGTPRGYKVFTKEGDRLTWYYKAVGHDRSFQHEVFMPGTTRVNPDCIVVNVWDYDNAWSIEWIEDGRHMGAMRQVEEYSPLHTSELEATYRNRDRGPAGHELTRTSKHCFAARPSATASQVQIIIRDRFGNETTETITLR